MRSYKKHLYTRGAGAGPWTRIVEVAAMDTDADHALDQLRTAYGEFWETWLVPTTIGAGMAIGAGVWCARLRAGPGRYINAESPAMLGILIDRDDQIAGRAYPPPPTGPADAPKGDAA